MRKGSDVTLQLYWVAEIEKSLNVGSILLIMLCSCIDAEPSQSEWDASLMERKFKRFKRNCGMNQFHFRFSQRHDQTHERSGLFVRVMNIESVCLHRGNRLV